MKKQMLVIGAVAALSLVTLTAFILTQYDVEFTKKDRKTDETISPVDPGQKIPPGKTSKECTLQPCHGLDLSCAFTNGPMMWTEMYALGDSCRQYANCDVVKGACVLNTSDKFEACKSCVARCQSTQGSDVAGAFSCESLCTQ